VNDARTAKIVPDCHAFRTRHEKALVGQLKTKKTHLPSDLGRAGRKGVRRRSGKTQRVAST